MQRDIARLGLVLGTMGEIWISDISRKTKYIITGVFITVDLIMFIWK